MRYKLLGRSGLRVSELALGTMTFGEEWGWGSSRAESQEVFKIYVEAGGNFIDTANRYTNGTSEKLVGEFIASDRQHFVLATKYSLSMRADDPNAGGNHRKNMVQALEASLRRLKTDYVDLYWLHAWDYLTPIEEVMRALDDQVRLGKVLYVGISDTPAWIVSRANMLAEQRGWTPFVALQVEYSLIQRTVERELLPMARALDLAITPWAVLGGGVLTGKYVQKEGQIEAEDSRRSVINTGRINRQNLHIAAEVLDIAEELGCRPAQVAISWIRQKPGVMIPIVGARTADQMRQNLECLQITLKPRQVARLDKVSHIELGFPHEFLSSETIRKVVYGDTYPLIDNHREEQ
jgi:aryl-alcohol dehydrogenase-like predicted oxidoreductase